MSSRTLTLGGTAYPVTLPSVRDARLQVAAVIVTIHVLGQVALHFHVSVPQILAAILTCAVIEVTLTFRRTRSFVWPASAMLTGSGVALILRVPSTPQGDHWTTHDWYVFAGVAGFSLLTKYLIRYRGSHVFNPSNVGLVVAFLAARQRPRRAARLLVGAARRLDDRGLCRDLDRRSADHAPPRPPRRGRGVLGRVRRGCRAARRIRTLHGRPLGVRPRVRVRLLAGDRHLAGGPHLRVLHDHRPEDGAARAGRPHRLRVPRRDRGGGAHGAPDGRVRDEGRAARQPGDRVCLPPAARAAGAGRALRRATTCAGSRRVSWSVGRQARGPSSWHGRSPGSA